MSDRTHDKEQDALNAGIASLREEIAALAAGVKKLAETKAAEPHAEGGHDTSTQGAPVNGAHDTWTVFQHALDDARAKGEDVVKDLAAAIERHPLLGGLAAFGLGFVIAKLWYSGRNQ